MTDILHEQRIDEFLNMLASDTPTPGGGSVAALSGAMAAGLVSMVCSISLGRKNLAEEDAQEFQSAHTQSEELRSELQSLAQADVEIFEHLSAAYKLPRTTDADAASRKAAIQKITREATEVPLKTARAAAAVIPLCTRLVNRCSRLLVSDIGVAALLARSAMHTSLLNVDINLSSLDDKLFVRETQAHREDLLGGLDEETNSIVEIVRSRIYG